MLTPQDQLEIAERIVTNLTRLRGEIEGGKDVIMPECRRHVELIYSVLDDQIAECEEWAAEAREEIRKETKNIF